MYRLFKTCPLMCLLAVFTAATCAQITDKKITKTRIVSAVPDTVWWKWTTHDGLLTFFGIENRVTLDVDGPYEIYFLQDQGQYVGSNGCKVLSFIPGEMLSFTWNAPPMFPDIRNGKVPTWVVVQMKPLDARRTEVTLQHLGWRKGGDWDKVYDYFDKAWDRVMDQLERSCVTR